MRFRPLVSSLAVGLTLCVLASACSSSPSKERSAAKAAGDPTTLPALPSAPGTGERVPLSFGAVLTPTSWVSSSLSPTLSIPGASGAWEFKLSDLSDGTSSFGTKTYRENGSSTRIPLGAGLQQGNTYTWSATSVDQQPVGGSFTVDVQLPGVQQLDSVGGVDVGLSSGEASFAWSSHSMGAVPGTVGFGLQFQSSNPDEVGVPRGWKLQAASNFPYTQINLWSPNSLGLVGSDGQVSNYRLGAGSEFIPVQSGSGELNTTGLAPVLTRNGDGGYAVTTKAATAIFRVEGEGGVAYLSSVVGDKTPMLGQTWKGGRLQSINDPVSGRKTSFAYGGGKCPATVEGFVTAPEGMLCSVSFWDGSTSSVLYVDTATGPTIGRLIDFPEAKGEGAQVTDLAYDQVGRLARTRSPLVASVAASGVIDANDQQFWSSVSYDETGRVVSITGASANAGGVRCTRAYENAGSRTTVSDSCFGGPVYSLDFDPTTFFALQMTNSIGLTASNQWDFATGQLLSSTDFSGLTTVNRYEDGELVQTAGPTKGSLADALSTLRSYDETFEQSPDGIAMNGLDVTYWAGSSASATSSVQEIGPRLNGKLVSGLTVNWPNSPAGNSGDWSGLMTGVLEVRTAGDYRIVSGNSTAKVRVNNVLCVDGACDRLPLAKGKNSLRIDLASNESQSSMDISWAGPDSNDQLTSIPMSSLRPGYGYVTTTKAVDPTVRDAVATNISRSSYDEPATGRVSSRTNQAGTRMSFSYQPQGKSEWVRQSGVTDGSGNSYRYTYWGDDESAKSPCPQASAINQGGAAKDTIAPGPEGGDGPILTRQWVDAAGRAIATQSAGGATRCTVFGPAGDVRSVEIIGLDTKQLIVNDNAVGGNPLIKQSAETDGDSVTTTLTEIDLFGRMVRSVDRYGIVSTYTYDDRTGGIATSTTTAPDTAPVVVTNIYGPSGRLASSNIDGVKVASLTYAPDGLVSSVTYGNGVELNATYDLTNALISMNWRTASGTYSNSRDVSAGGTVMASTFTTPQASSTFSYVHDDNGRLSATSVSAGIVPSNRSWAWTFDASSNRTSQTVTDNGSVVRKDSYTYNRAAQLVSTTDPIAAGGIQYDDRGNATIVGPDSFTYDAANRLIGATDGSTTVAYERGVAGEIVSKTTSGGVDEGTIRYSGSGVLLDASSKAYAKQFVLPFGAVYTKSLTGAPGRWQHTAINGDGYLVLNDTGALVGAPQIYDPYGNVLTVPDALSPGLPSTTWEASTGNETESFKVPFQLMGSRVYVPGFGRFLQLDPKVGGSANGYDYVNQDPVDFTDPSGNESENWLVSGLSALAATAAAMLLAPARGALVGAAVGFLAGAAVAGVATAIEYAVTGQTSFSAVRLGMSILAGAIGGAIAGRVKWAKAENKRLAPIRAEQSARANLEYLGGNAASIQQNAGWISANASEINTAAQGYKASITSTEGLSRNAVTALVRQQVDGVESAARLMSDPAFIDVGGREAFGRFFLYVDMMADNARAYAAFKMTAVT